MSKLLPQSATNIDLRKPLPYSSRLRWGYQHYPVFSPMWWRGRTLVFGFGALCFTLITGAGMALDFDDSVVAVNTTLTFLIGVLGMVLTGATVCTLVRTWVTPGNTQKVLIVISLMLGIICTSLFDAWSSGVIETAFLEHSSQKEQLAELTNANTTNASLMVINAFFGAGLYFWLAGGIAFIRYWREPRQLSAYFAAQELAEAKASKLEAQTRLSTLQAQIEPHFLFNSLASIKSVVRDNPELAESSIDDLVDYLRASVPRLNKQQQAKPSSLQEQVELCQKYLKVMQLRMGERLSFNCEVDPRVAQLPFPALVIVSLVENAIKHGIEPNIEGGHIDVKAVSELQTLHISVTDNGVGLNPEQVISLSSGVGLANIKQQLHVIFGDSARLELNENPHGGATSSITVHNFLK